MIFVVDHVNGEAALWAAADSHAEVGCFERKIHPLTGRILNFVFIVHIINVGDYLHHIENLRVQLPDLLFIADEEKLVEKETCFFRTVCFQ